MQTDAGRVLIVDDEPVVCRSFERVLSDAGYDVHAETSGTKALATFEDQPFDVVLTDLKIPDVNGLEITRKMRAARPEVPVMIVTGYGTPETEREAEKLGVFKFLNKPLAPDDLCDAAAEAMASTFGKTSGTVLLPANPTLPFPDKEEPEPKRGVLKSLGLLLAAPFLGLAYVISLPFIGFGMLLMAAVRSVKKWFGRKGKA